MLLASTDVALVYTRARCHEERSNRDLCNRLIEIDECVATLMTHARVLLVG